MSEESYEIVPIDPWSRAEKKSEDLEKEIREIKSALRGTVGLGKLETHADEFITKIIDMIHSSQIMVSEVAKSNKEVAGKINLAIEQMTQANKDLSAKLNQLVEFFSEASEGMEEGEDFTAIGKTFAESMNSLKGSMDSLVEQTKRNQEILGAIERHLKRQKVTQTVKQRYAPPPGAAPPPGLPPPPGGVPPLPPPPAPP